MKTSEEHDADPEITNVRGHKPFELARGESVKKLALVSDAVRGWTSDIVRLCFHIVIQCQCHTLTLLSSVITRVTSTSTSFKALVQ